jgi:hypothetical protein
VVGAFPFKMSHVVKNGRRQAARVEGLDGRML